MLLPFPWLRFPWPHFLLACLLLLPAFGSAAESRNMIVSREVLTDSAGTLGIDDVTKAQFAEAGPLLSRGFTGAAHWLRIVVRAPRDDEFELRIRPTYLDEVRLYEPDPARPGAWLERVTGDRYPHAERLATTLGFMLRSQGQETTYYLRLVTTSSSQLNVEALEPEPARAADLRRLFLHAVYLCLGLVIALLALHELLTLRTRLMVFFLIYLVTQLTQSLAVTGYLSHVLPAWALSWTDVLTNILVLGTIATGALFYRQLFGTYGAAPLGLRLLEGAVLLFVLELALIAAGHTREAMLLNGQVVFFMGLLLVAVALSMRAGPQRERRVIKRLIAAQAGALGGTMLPLLGLVEPSTEWILNIGLLHGIITCSVMYAILNFRARALLDTRKQVEMELALTSRMLEAERRRSSEQARFMDMLTHELKTPLAAVKMVFGMPNASDSAKAYAIRALDDMDAVVERCRQLDQLEQGAMAPRREPCRMDELLDEVMAAYRSSDRVVLSVGKFPVVESDRHLLKVILNNLLDNALKYSAPDSPIHVDLRCAGEDGKEWVRFAISNRPGSAGVPDPARVFDKYYRAPHAYKYTGSGLGLYLVRSFTELLDGRLVYEHVDNQVSFTLWIPV